MDLREQLEGAVEELTATHEQNRVAYREAKDMRDAANAKVRELCDKASASANELGAAKKALDELNRTLPPAVEGSGNMQASSAESAGE